MELAKMILFLNDRVELLLASIAFALAIIAVIFDSVTCAIAISCMYLVGTIWGVDCIRYVKTNFAILPKNAYSTEQKKKSCQVCGNDSCERHKKTVQNNWVKVPKDLNEALEHLYEKLLETYVCTWYSTLSNNRAFVQELRFAIATATRNITARLFCADISQIIFNNLIPVALQHAEDWQELSKRAKMFGANPQDYVADYLGSKVHVASYSREAELNYLRGIATALTPFVLPTTNISTNNRVILREILANWVLLPAIDALADPENINTLIILSTHYEGEFSEATNTYSVPLLHSWIAKPVPKPETADTLKPNLDDILNNPQLLYIFMQHIKESGPVNLLQFFLDIDDLIKRIMNPDMTPDAEKLLYTDAQSMYDSYLDPESPDYVHLPLHVSEGMQQILEGGPKKIQELRTSRPLYNAHEEAHALLESTCVSSFHHCYELYKQICGEPENVPSSITSYRQNSSGSGISSKLSTQLGKMKGVLRAQAVEGTTFDMQNPIYHQAEEVISDEKSGCDLTTWRVTIPHVDGAGTQPMYMIAVDSVAEDKSWKVLRRDQDFYALRTRLAEFHGDRELNDSPLPTRKNQHPMANCQIYQEFLQKLLSKPTLRSSELLQTFLTAPNLKPYISAYSATDLGVIYQSMTHKLRKERGQNLDRFMQVFFKSTYNKSDHTDVGVEMFSDQKPTDVTRKGRDLCAPSSPFGNNLNLDPHIKDFPYVTSKRQHVKGACFCVAEAVDSLLNVSPTKSKVVWLIASLLHQKLDPVINKQLHNVLVKLLSGGRAALVVKLLQSVIFDPKKESSGVTLSGFERYSRARSGLHSILPWWFVGAYSQWCKLMDSLLDPLQNPSLNKHLAYVLLDQLLINLFPELELESQKKL